MPPTPPLSLPLHYHCKGRNPITNLSSMTKGRRVVASPSSNYLILSVNQPLRLSVCLRPICQCLSPPARSMVLQTRQISNEWREGEHSIWSAAFSFPTGNQARYPCQLPSDKPLRLIPLFRHDNAIVTRRESYFLPFFAMYGSLPPTNTNAVAAYFLGQAPRLQVLAI